MLGPGTGEITKYKLGTDWLIAAEQNLHQHPDVIDFWRANEKEFYRVQQKATEAKNKKAIDHCGRVATLAHTRTKTAEIIP